MADDDSSDDDLDQQQQPPSRYLATVRMPSGTASRSSRASVSSSGSDSDSDDAGSAAVLHSVTALNSSLSAFEQTHIRPLVGPDGRSLRDTLAGISDEVERAKLLVTLGYVIEDLVWSASLLPQSTCSERGANIAPTCSLPQDEGYQPRESPGRARAPAD